MILYFIVNKTTLERQDDEIIASYSKNIDKCYFKCENRWAHIYKYALFTDALNNQYIVDLGFGERVGCVIPNDVLKNNFFSVSIFGGDRYTTTQENILVQPSGFNDQTEENFESGDMEIIDNSFSDTYKHKIWEYNQIRLNRFEIEEHPYY